MNTSTLRFFQTNLYSGAVNSIETPSSKRQSHAIIPNNNDFFAARSSVYNRFSHGETP